MADKKLHLIEKLNDRNYIHWSFRMEMVLKQNECWDVTQEEKPADTKQADWQKKDDQARYLIAICVENSQITHVKSHKSAKEVWNALKKFHQRSTMSSKTRLLKKLFKAELKTGDHDMEKHLQTLQEWIDELNDLDYKLDEKYIKSIILASLNVDYDMVVTVLEARDEDKLTISEIKAKLLDEADRLKQKSANDSSTAFMVTRDYKKFGRNSAKNINCYTCGEEGHISKYCEKRFKKSGESSEKQQRAGFAISNNLEW